MVALKGWAFEFVYLQFSLMFILPTQLLSGNFCDTLDDN